VPPPALPTLARSAARRAAAPPQVKALRARYPKLNIQVDGGITVDTVDVVARAGANVLVSGTGIYAAPDPREAITALRHSVQRGGLQP
jgi:ribulose-phosphate 3-epimerase